MRRVVLLAVAIAACSSSSSDPSLRGQVVDSRGAPIKGALVCTHGYGLYSRLYRTVTNADGRFAVAVPAGRYALGVSAPGHDAHLGERFDHSASTPERRVELRPAGGRVRGAIGDPGDVDVTIARLGEPRAAICLDVDEDGRFDVGLAPARYELSGGQRAYVAGGDFEIAPGQNTHITPVLISAERYAEPPSAAVAAAIGSIASPLKAAEPGSGIDDLAVLDSVVDGADVVGLGEATHGTREFAQLRHRIIEYLVERHGFTAVVIEQRVAMEDPEMRDRAMAAPTPRSQCWRTTLTSPAGPRRRFTPEPSSGGTLEIATG